MMTVTPPPGRRVLARVDRAAAARWPDAAAVDRGGRAAEGEPAARLRRRGSRRSASSLAKAIDGRAFLLQAGDCVESFNEISTQRIREKLKIMLQMSAVLTYGATLPVVKLGRIAGQFTKPRSDAFERIGGEEIPSFRGHMVNGDEPNAAARIPDPRRMLEGYNQSASTLNLLRAFTKGGYADLTQVHLWNKDFVSTSPEGRRYEPARRARSSVRSRSCSLRHRPRGERRLHEVDVFTSHEGLLLDYEEGLTRRDSLTGDWYDCSAHLLWIGERTRQLDGAHVEFFSGVHNPIGVKLGPGATPTEVDRARASGSTRCACRAVSPSTRAWARSTCASCCRRSCARCATRGIRCSGPRTRCTATASARRRHVKTRRFDAIMAELEGFFDACWEVGVWPGGVHLEFTGEDVTECLGGADDVLEEQLASRYETLLDPRLNARQSLDLAFRLAELMRAPR